MRELNKTVEYYLGDLNKEQRSVLYYFLIKVDETYNSVTKKGFIHLSEDHLYFCEKQTEWKWVNRAQSGREIVNALTLFEEEPQFKQGDKVLVRDDEDDEWLERLYATEYNGNHYVEAKHSNELSRYVFIKHYEEQIKTGDWVKIMSNGLIFKSKENINKDGCWFDYKKITNPQLITLLENELSN